MQLEQGKVEREHSNGRMDRMRKELEKRSNDTQLELEATQHKLQASDAALTAVKGRAEVNLIPTARRVINTANR